MKTLILILTLILSQQVSANNSCFSTKEIRDLIEASEDIDRCFIDDKEDCGYSAKSVVAQKEINKTRLIPIDRTKGNGFLDSTVGIVSAEFGNGFGEWSNKTVEATAQKISRCHIITSAHLIYNNGLVPTNKNSDIQLNFSTGQTCDPENPVETTSPGKIMFHLLSDSSKYKCKVNDNGKCEKRFIYGENDVMIVKLAKGSYDPNDRQFFSLDTRSPGAGRQDLRVNCWGFPGHNNQISLSKKTSDMLLWGQKNAKIFFSHSKYSENGIPTNAIAYRGMSGGGCSTSENPRVLVGIFANGNSVFGNSAIHIPNNNGMAGHANYVSPFHKLAEEFRKTRQAHNKANPNNRPLVTELSQLDSECD